MKAPMLEAYAGFKWVMFHMVFLMEPFGSSQPNRVGAKFKQTSGQRLEENKSTPRP